MRLPGASLKQKLIVGVALVHAVLMVSFLFDLIERQRSFLSVQFVRETQALASVLATGSTAAVLANDVMGMAEFVQSLPGYPGVRYASLLGRDGRVLAHSDGRLVGQYAVDEVSQGLLEGGPGQRLLAQDAGGVDVAAPIRGFEGRVVAWARVGRVQLALEEARSQALRNGLGYALAAVVIGTLFAWLLAQDITRELVRLVGATRRVRAGERDVSVATTRADELGDLSRAFQDMTVALQAREHALQESEHRWLMALEGAGHGVWDWNVVTNHVYYSHTWRAMLGFSDADVLDRLDDWKKHVDPDDLPACLAAIEAHLAGATPYYRSVYRLRARDGRHLWVLDQGTLFERAGDGSPLRMVGTITDITAQKLAEEENECMQRQLDHSRKMEAMGQLTGGVAHDFNNILCIIISNLELVLTQCQDPDARECLEDAATASRRAAELVAKMLAYSRTTLRSVEPLDPGPAVREVLRLLASTLPSSLEFVTTIEPVREVLVSAIELQQLVMNLVINARDAVGEHGRVQVGLREVQGHGEQCSICRSLIQGEFVELSVSDNGQGMSPEVLSRAFDPFFTTKPVGKGTGMGLSMVQGIVRAAGGHVHVTSSPAAGTTLRILLPPGRERGPVLEAAGPAAVVLCAAPLRVLVVDDEELLVRTLARALHQRGHQATVFTDSRAALEAFESDSGGFDALITDHTMPELTGVELANKILARRPGLPVFLCTGNTDRVDVEAVHCSGIRLFEKPVSPGVLLPALEESCRVAAQQETGARPA